LSFYLFHPLLSISGVEKWNKDIDCGFIVHKSQMWVTAVWGAAMGIWNGFLRRVFKNANSYHCWHCGYELPKEKAVISGWDCQQSLCHVHCPKCGKIITHAP